jgi:Fe-S cluster assembly protein SufD
MSTPEFLSSIKEIFISRSPTPLREKAWNRFLELGLPDKSTDAFRYVPLRKLYDYSLKLTALTLSKETIAPHLFSENTIVFASGKFIPELSNLPPQMVILPLQEALKSYGSFLQSRLAKNLKEETDPFAALNLACHDGALFCYLPPKQIIESPLQIIYYGEESYHSSHLTLFCSTDSQLSTISTIVGSGFHHTSFDVAIEERAHFSHLETSAQGSGIHFSDFKATLKKSSTLKHLSLQLAKRLSRQRLHVSLLGEDSDALLQGLWHLTDSHQNHTHVYVQHAAPSARSLQKYKGVLKDFSQSSFEGKIYVEPEAQKTQAYQVNHNLLLGEGAIANAKPNLEIFADDVKASHGATTAQVDEELLFYLQSRGHTKEGARTLLVRGFIQEVLDQVPYPFLRQTLEAHVF